MTSWLLAVVTWWGTVLGPGDADAACLRLGLLDVARAEAFASAAPGRLADVYAARSLQRTDAAVLRAWTARGFRLEGMGQLRSSCRVVEVSPSRVRLEVVDRLAPTRAVRGGRVHRLPIDRPTRRTVVLVATDHGWRVTGLR